MSVPAPTTSSATIFENDAKAAYNIWAYRTGTTAPYEYLSLVEMQAFREIVEYIYNDGYEDAAGEEPSCEDCGGSLVCLKCEPNPDCPTCGQLMGCEDCAEKRVKAKAAAMELARQKFPDDSGAWAI